MARTKKVRAAWQRAQMVEHWPPSRNCARMSTTPTPKARKAPKAPKVTPPVAREIAAWFENRSTAGASDGLLGWIDKCKEFAQAGGAPPAGGGAPKVISVEEGPATEELAATRPRSK